MCVAFLMAAKAPIRFVCTSLGCPNHDLHDVALQSLNGVLYTDIRFLLLVVSLLDTVYSKIEGNSANCIGDSKASCLFSPF